MEINTAKAFKWTLQLISYLTLSTFFVYFYLIDQMTDFTSGRTAVTSRFEKVKALEPPTLTVCVNPRFKLTVAQDYGMKHSWSQMIPASNTNNETTYGARFSKLSYILNHDYEIKIAITTDETRKNATFFTLDLGINSIKNRDFEVKEIQTGLHGTCVVIIPKFMITKTPFGWELFFIPSSNLEEKNMISKFIIYLTSNDSWHSLIPAEWPLYNPTVLKVDQRSYYYYPGKVTEYLYAQGTQNTENCMTESIKKSDCPVKCSVGSLADLPKCNTSEEVDCIWTSTSTLEGITRCNRKKRGLTFNGDLEELENYDKNNSQTIVAIFINALEKEIREEVDIITTSGFIGSVGGSLGMFFGFSISACLLNFFDSLTKNFSAQ